jgi:pyridoxal phosphate enzyme (YggS family)
MEFGWVVARRRWRRLSLPAGLLNGKEPDRVAKEQQSLAENLAQVRARIEEAAARAKRDPAEVTLIAVTKYAAPEQIREIIQLGVADLGESKVQQIQQRVPQINEFHQRLVTSGREGVPGRLRWHMIGRLQRNKVKPLLPLITCVHSIDSLRLGEEIDTVAAKMSGGAAAGQPPRRVPVLMQVNASEEPQKSGVAVGASVHLAEQLDSMPHLQLVGLMTMAAADADEKAIRHTFARTREIFEEIKWNKIGGAGFKHLSMGMTHDFEIAIEEGATMVRIGSALFGVRPEGVEEEED